jgi:RNA-directed DNA polymerase
MKYINNHIISLEPKGPGYKITLMNTKLGMEPKPSGLGHGVIIVGRFCSTKGSQLYSKSSQPRVSVNPFLRPKVQGGDSRTLTRQLFNIYGIKESNRHNGLIRVIGDKRLLVQCYEEIRTNKGSMAKGTKEETLDGLTLAWIDTLSKELISGSYKFGPARKVMIPKPRTTTKRPLGVPREKIVQKALQVALECIYEPRFLESSHGFRPNRGCHSALYELYRHGGNHEWVMEGHIAKCFDSIPHSVMMRLIDREVSCDKTKTLITKALKAGYRDDTGRVLKPKNGTPQGSVLSPFLSNVTLHQLDRYMAKLSKLWRKGEIRRINPVFRKAYRQKNITPGDKRRIISRIPSKDPLDPNFRRLKYVRYADDFVVLSTSSYKEVALLKDRIKIFLKERLGLTLSTDKTKVTSIQKGFTFLGANLIKVPRGTKPMPYIKYQGGNKSGKRRVNLRLRVLAPINKLIKRFKEAKLVKLSKGKGLPYATAKRALVPIDHADILAFYNQKIRGILNYYSFAGNRGQLHRVLNFLYMGCALTLALKYKTRTARATFKKFGGNLKDQKTGSTLYRPKNLRASHQPLFEQLQSW